MTDVLFELLTLDCRVDEYGTVQYYNTLGKLHRVHGPAIEYSDGRCAWWQNGQLHRLGGPAVEWADGYRAWYHKGQLHRLDGPAIEYPDGTYEWWLNGRRLSQAQWRQEVTNMETV